MHEIIIGEPKQEKKLTPEEMETGEYKYSNYKKEYKELEFERNDIFKYGGVDFMNDSSDFAHKLIEKYGDTDARDCLFFHIVAQSTPPNEVIYTRVDFLGDDSVKKFIDEAYDEFFEKQEERKVA